MKKFTYLTFCFLFTMLFGKGLLAQDPQVFIDEEFERSFPPAGWSMQNGETSEMHWESQCFSDVSSEHLHSYILSEGCCVEISSTADTPLQDEWLITNSITIPTEVEHTQLSFMWQCNKVYSVDKDTYDVKVKISEDDGSTWTEIWAEDNQEMIENSYITWPWPHFGHLTAKIDISQYKGKTIKIAFNYITKSSDSGNSFRLDAVKVQEYTPMSGPIVGGAPGNCSFDKAIEGQHIYSGDIFQLVNNGIGTLTVSSIEGLEGTDFSTDLVPADVSLGEREVVNFGVYFNPSKEGATDTDLVIHTNGGDFICHLTGEKELLPERYSMEGFDGDVFPPAGWTQSSDKWRASNYNALSPNNAAYCYFVDGSPTLMSPRLDMSVGEHTLTFFYYEDGDDYNENETYVKFSKDGGNKWEKIKTLSFTNSKWTKVVIDLGEPQSDNCYIKFEYYLIIEGWNSCGASRIDDVILPPIYQDGGVPTASANPEPLDEASEQNISLILRWDPALLADYYKVNIGTTKENPTDVISGVEVKDATEYFASNLDYATTYYWQVIPVNETGEALDCPVWSFSTFDDPTIKVFPYFMGFEDNKDNMPPLGWLNYGDREWISGNVPFSGDVCARTTWGIGNANLQMPPVDLPQDKNMQISFYWKDNDIYTDHKVAGSDSTFFEISEDGGINWNRLGFLSADEPMADYERIKFELSEYKGKTVIFRWRDFGSDNFHSKGTGLDEIQITAYKDAGMPYICKKSWSAGRHNYHVQVESGPIFNLLNDGSDNLTIESAVFSDENFSSDLDIDIDLAPGESVDFGFKFNPVESGQINTTYTLTFNSGDVVTINLDGYANPVDVRFYSFEENEDFVIDIPPFKLVDVDRMPTVEPVMTNFDNRGAPFAYIVMNHTKTFYNAYAKTGDKALMSLTVAKENIDCNDWIITPKATAKEGAEFSFWAKSYTDQFKLSQFNVLVSETDDEVNSFTVLDEGELLRAGSSDWKKYTFDLSAYAGKDIYLAIQNVTAYEGFVFMIDDIEMSKFLFAEIPNKKPVFESTAVTEATEDELYSYDVIVSDGDNDKLDLSLKEDVSWLIFEQKGNGQATLSGTPVKENVGEQSITIIANDGIESVEQTFTIQISKEQSTDIDVLETEVKIYPNPASSVITIECEEDVRIALYNINGTLVVDEVTANTINVSELPKGIYFLQVKYAGKTITRKVEVVN